MDLSAAGARKPSRLRARAAVKGLFVWGLAAAALALSVMLAPTGSLFLLGTCAPPTDAEAAYLRAQAALLLLSGVGQALAAQVALLVPWRHLGFLAWLVASRTFNHAARVILTIAVCPGGHIHGELESSVYYYGIFYGIMWVALVAAAVVVTHGGN